MCAFEGTTDCFDASLDTLLLELGEEAFDCCVFACERDGGPCVFLR